MNREIGIYDVMDTDGRVKEWAERDGLVKVWRNAAMDSFAPDVITPIKARSPGWRYPEAEAYDVEARALRFYAKGTIVFLPGRGNLEWSDTPVGYRSAARMVATLPESNAKEDGTWPPLRLAFRYSIERVTYETRERNAAGLALGIHYRWAIIQWSIRLGEDEGQARSAGFPVPPTGGAP